MDDIDDVPELDDMSAMVAGIKLSKQRNHTQSHDSSAVCNSTLNTQEDSVAGSTKLSTGVKAEVNESAKSKKQFAGMKKGFLFGKTKDSPKPNQKLQAEKGTKKANDIDIISPKSDPKKNALVFDEVQDAMKDVISDKSWMTDDLLSQVDSNEKLSKQLMDPRISEAVSRMQKDPKGAMEYYKDDIEIQNFFKEFYSILGNHFTNLSTKQGQTKSSTDGNLDPEDEKAMQKILSDTKVREILSKPEIQTLLQQLRTDPDEAQKILNSGDFSLRDDVNKLVSAGVLSFQAT